MANHAKRIVSAALCISMLVSLVPYCFAAEANADTSGERSYFDFDASEYEVRENDGSLKVKIVRRGGGNAEADVSLKAADLCRHTAMTMRCLTAAERLMKRFWAKSRPLRTLSMTEMRTILQPF